MVFREDYRTFYVAKDWGTLVSTAFDLYRDDLKKSLKIISIPKSLDDEREMWNDISEFIKHSNDTFDRFYEKYWIGNKSCHHF